MTNRNGSAFHPTPNPLHRSADALGSPSPLSPEHPPLLPGKGLEVRNDSFILFELAGATYALSSQVVKHMEMIEQMTPVPHTDPWVDGVVLSRGQVIPALNLRVRFGFEPTPYTLRTRLIVVSVLGRTVGLVVDSAREFMTIPGTMIQPLPDTISEQSKHYLSGIAMLAVGKDSPSERLILLLNVEALLSVDPPMPLLADV